MKEQLRVMGVVSAPFTFEQDRVELVASVCRLPGYLEEVMIGSVDVDGLDATDTILSLISDARPDLSAVLTVGTVVAGFNPIDLKELQGQGVPVIPVLGKIPDADAVEQALKAHHDDWEIRMKITSGHSWIKHPDLDLFYSNLTSMDGKGVELLLKRSIVQGRTPEVVRISHMVASALGKGESSGKAL